MTSRRTTHRPGRLRARGVSLVELMVASALGLLVTLAVTSSLLTMSRQSSIVSSNVAAQGSAQIALSLLDAAGRSAGAGFYNGGRLICPTWYAWNGTAVVSNGAVLMPARIISGDSGSVSDTVVFTAGTGSRPLSAVPVMVEAGPQASVKVSNAGNFASGDLALIGAPGSGVPCTLFQVTGAPAVSSGCDGNATSCRVLIRNPDTGLNPNPSTFPNTPTFGFAADTHPHPVYGPAVVSRVGSTATGFRQDAFGVQCNSLVRFNAFINATVPACTASPLAFGAGVDAIATDVVLMHAQYGISDTPASDVVTSWVEPSGGTWGAPTADNVGRIKALRVVLVARSKEADAAQVSSACTNPNGVVNVGPCSFQDAAAPAIDLSATTVAPGKTWRNYRYRVHQAVIPLRNVIWSDA